MRREQFLSAVATASMRTSLPSPSNVSELPAYQVGDLVGRFRVNAQAVNTVVHGPVSRHGVPRSVSAIAAGHGAKSFVAWDVLPAAGVTASLVAEGMKRLDHRVPSDGDRKARNAGFQDLDVGITGAEAGLAESGSLILSHGEGRPRMASLIPEIHIAILDVNSIASTLAHWAAANPEMVNNTTNLVMVTGPSRTGDIEQQLNLGVHGPRHVHVVLTR